MNDDMLWGREYSVTRLSTLHEQEERYEYTVRMMGETNN